MDFIANEINEFKMLSLLSDPLNKLCNNVAMWNYGLFYYALPEKKGLNF